MSTINTERNVLATLLHKPDLAGKVFTRVPVGEFTGPNLLVAEAIQQLRVARKPIDVTTVADEMRRRSTLQRVGGDNELHQMAAWFVSAASLDYHLDALADKVRLRKLYTIGDRLSQMAGMDDADGAMLAHDTAERVQAIIDQVEAEQDITTPTLGEFLAGEDEPYDWTIPGMLERSDRLMLTGSEGLGKSVLFRQIAVAAAAGIHPLNPSRRIEPQRVLYVDVENSRSKLRRHMRSLVTASRQAGGDPSTNLFIECRPEGLDLTRAEDELWLVSRVVALQPSILLTGPVYRLHAKNPNEEEPARKVAAVLDRCRAAANCSLVLEAHAGHGIDGTGKRSVRPTGTSLWLRWPEFGYGIRAGEDFTEDNRLVDFVPWRGDRDERDWPSRLRRGGTWPWQIATDPNAHWSPGIERGA